MTKDELWEIVNDCRDITEQSFSLASGGKPSPADAIYNARRSLVLAAYAKLQELVETEEVTE